MKKSTKTTTNQGEITQNEPETPEREMEVPDEFKTPMKYPPGPWSTN